MGMRGTKKEGRVIMIHGDIAIAASIRMGHGDMVYVIAWKNLSGKNINDERQNSRRFPLKGLKTRCDSGINPKATSGISSYIFCTSCEHVLNWHGSRLSGLRREIKLFGLILMSLFDS